MRVLLIGNAGFYTEINLGDYDEIVIFNQPADPEWLKIATSHWGRGIGKDLRKVAGSHLFSSHKAKITVCDAINAETREMVASLRASGRQVRETRVLAEIPPGYPTGKCASTGFAAINHYLRRGDHVAIANFSWQGWIGHAWDYEKEFCSSLIKNGRITILNPPPPLRLAHFVWMDIHQDGESKDLDRMQYWSIKTFLMHHAGWRVQFWTNVSWTGPLFSELLSMNLQVIPLSKGMLPFKPQFACDGADYVRWLALAMQGGLYVDMDTITIGSFDDQVRSPRVRWWWSRDKSMFRSGVLAVGRPGSPFCRQICDYMASPGFRPGSRADMELKCRQLINAKCPGVEYEPRSHRVVYPIFGVNLPKVIQRGTIGPSLFPDTLQVHWYLSTGDLNLPFHQLVRTEVARLDTEDWQTAPGALFDLIRTSHSRCSTNAGAEVLIEEPKPVNDVAIQERVFGDIVKRRHWENMCGPGSHPDACRPYWQDFLPAFFKDYQIRSVLDWGCGDWQHSQFIDWTGIDYLGVDIVREFVDQAKGKFARPGVEFSHVSDFQFGRRAFDLMIVKEVFIHWPNQAVKDFLDSIKGVRMLLVVNSVDFKTNTDISFGEFRSFDPSKPPFNLPVDKVFSYRFAGHEYAIFKLLMEIPVQPVDTQLVPANC